MDIEVKIPSVGESVTEVTLANWLVEDGAYVEMDDALCELETDKASQELYAEAAGTIKLVVEAGSNIGIGTIIAMINGNGAKVEKVSQPTNTTAPINPKPSADYASGHPSPAAAKILSEKGIALSQVVGSGIDGRITKSDAENAKTATPTVAKEQPKTTSVEIVNSTERVETAKKMSRLRQTIAHRLVEVKNQTAMLTTFNEIDMYEVMELRKKYKEQFKEKHDVGLGFMSFFTKAATLAAKQFPAVNGKISGDEVITYNYVDMGIAVSTPRGLVVPIIRNAHAMNLAQIEKAVIENAVKARDNKLSMDDMQGGTFTITNGGVFGSMLSTPIINGDQSAILGMHNIVQRPMAVNGQVVIRPIMYVALSYDHRIVDGKESVGFLYRIKELIEDPARLLLEV